MGNYVRLKRPYFWASQFLHTHILEASIALENFDSSQIVARFCRYHRGSEIWNHKDYTKIVSSSFSMGRLRKKNPHHCLYHETKSLTCIKYVIVYLPFSSWSTWGFIKENNTLTTKKKKVRFKKKERKNAVEQEKKKENSLTTNKKSKKTRSRPRKKKFFLS